MPEPDLPTELLEVNERLLLSGLRIEELASALRRQLAFTSAITNSLDEGVLTLDQHGLLTYANPAALRLLGWAEADLIGRNLHDMVHRGCRESCPLLQAIRTGATWRHDDDVFFHQDGSCLPTAYSVAPIVVDSHVAGSVIAFRNVTERKQFEEALAHRALHDALTGLPNRLLLQDRATQALLHAQRDGTAVAMLFVDLDNFKAVNDQFGHPVGDQFLIAVARRLQTHMRSSDTIARIGGDEFTLMLSPISDDHAVVAFVDRLFATFATPIQLGAYDVVVRMSIGIAISTDGALTLDELLHHADAAMYQAKRQGSSHYAIHAEHAPRERRPRQ